MSADRHARDGKDLYGKPGRVDVLRNRDGAHCALCGWKFAKITTRGCWTVSVDHIVPVSLGGSDDVDNLRLAHVFCNMWRGNSYHKKIVDMSEQYYRHQMIKRGFPAELRVTSDVFRSRTTLGAIAGREATPFRKRRKNEKGGKPE